MKEDLLETPSIQTFLMCDLILNDRLQNKFSVIGIFDIFTAAEFPFSHQGFYLYIVISGGHGIIPFKLRCIDLNTLEGVDIFKDAWKVVEPTKTIPPLLVPVAPTFPHSGAYTWELTVDKPGHRDHGYVICSRRFEVRKSDPNKAQQIIRPSIGE